MIFKNYFPISTIVVEAYSKCTYSVGVVSLVQYSGPGRDVGMPQQLGGRGRLA